MLPCRVSTILTMKRLACLLCISCRFSSHLVLYQRSSVHTFKTECYITVGEKKIAVGSFHIIPLSSLWKTVSKSSPFHQSHTSLKNAIIPNLDRCNWSEFGFGWQEHVSRCRLLVMGRKRRWNFQNIVEKKKSEGIITTIFLFHLNTSCYVSVHCSRFGFKGS